MVRCFFSDARIENYTWQQNGHHICYRCQARRTTETGGKHIAHILSMRELFQKLVVAPKKKKKSERHHPKTKVDRRIIGYELPPTIKQLEHGFSMPPKTENIIRPRISYPYLTSLAEPGIPINYDGISV